MSGATLFGLLGAALVALAIYGLITGRDVLRRIVALNLMGAGAFLFYGAVARRAAGAGLEGDPVPQALVITGIVVAFAATAVAVALALRLAQTEAAETAEAQAADAAHAAQAGSAASTAKSNGD